MAGYEPTQWHELFLGVLGAAAALAGLLFVGVSINVARITALKGLPERGLEAIVLLVGLVLASVFALVPQPAAGLGVELIALGLCEVVGFALLHRAQWQAYERRYRRALLVRGPVDYVAALSFAVAGVTLLLHAGGGLYWTVPAIAVGTVAAVVNAWVLLVEILR
jgi:hypothetical protein